MIDWIGYGWIAGEVSEPDTFFPDLTIEVPRADVVDGGRGDWFFRRRPE